MRIDMHIHTTASDGTWPPEILVKKILYTGIQVFTVTDHDSVDNILPVSKLAKDAKLRFIPGVEINVSYNKKNYHILGYGIDYEDQGLNDIMTRNKDFLEERNIEYIIFLKNKGYPVSIEEYSTYSNIQERGGWKTLNYIIDKGICQNIRDFFRLIEEMSNPFDNTNFVSPETAISCIQKARGIPVLAHPGAKIYNTDYKTTIALMFELGIKGIECYHPENNAEVTGYCIDFCKNNKLYITGGSDCHGDFVKERILGKPEIQMNQVEIGNLVSRYL